MNHIAIFFCLCQLPSSHEEWGTISNDLRNRWNFPLCCGGIDGKHVLIKAPDEGSEYYNYKGFNSTVLMAVADYKYCVSYFEVGEKRFRIRWKGFPKLLTFVTFGEWIASHWKFPCWGRCIPT